MQNKREPVYWTLTDGKRRDLKSPTLRESTEFTDIQEEITDTIPSEIKKLRDTLWEKDEEGNPTELVSDAPEIKKKIKELEKKAMVKGAEVCVKAFKDEAMTVDFFLDNATMDDYVGILTFLAGGQSALANYFRSLK